VKYLYGHDGAVCDFVASLIPSCRERGFGNAKAIGVLNNDGFLIAGIVYHNYDPDAEIIEISGAALPGVNWLTRETLRRTTSGFSACLRATATCSCRCRACWAATRTACSACSLTRTGATTSSIATRLKMYDQQNAQRDAITQALMNVANPPPQAMPQGPMPAPRPMSAQMMPQMQGMPPAPGLQQMGQMTGQGVAPPMPPAAPTQMPQVPATPTPGPPR
jgi:hypothetical protein